MVEAIVEDEKSKKKTKLQGTRSCIEWNAIIATNTSSISIEKLSSDDVKIEPIS